MNTLHIIAWKSTRVLLLSMFSLLFFSTSTAWARSADLSTDTINISAGETGSFTISGDDDGDDRFQFRWDIPSGLNVSKGSSSNVNKFEIDWEKMRIKVESDANGSFSATVNVSANNTGTFVLQNTRAEISLSPSDVTINVGGTAATEPARRFSQGSPRRSPSRVAMVGLAAQRVDRQLARSIEGCPLRRVGVCSAPTRARLPPRSPQQWRPWTNGGARDEPGRQGAGARHPRNTQRRLRQVVASGIR